MASNLQDLQDLQDLRGLQGQIDDAVIVMQKNIEKVAQRGERLDSLQDTAENLSVSAKHFRRGANRVRKLTWLKDMKMVLCSIIVVILVIAAFVSIVVTKR
jgi:vesicle-associated membrane protein 4